MEELQKALGHRFNSVELLNLALRHKSCGSLNNERMEFLGDSILNFVVADYIFSNHPTLTEGTMTRFRAGLTCETTLTKLARRLRLGDYIKRTTSTNDIGFNSMLADGVEALFAAVYKDAGYEVAKKVIIAHVEEIMRLGEAQLRKDPKTALQEILQGKGHPLPSYSVITSSKNEFEVVCEVISHGLRTTARGGSRKLAERAAAEKAVKALQSGTRLTYT